MATRVQNRRGSTAEHSTFTGAVGEVTVDTDKEVVVVHDGTTAGGYPQMRENGSQNLVTTGSITGGRFIPTSSTVPTNGVYLPAANSVAISTSGAGRVFVDASGNVGVGTSPAYRLDVAGSIRSTAGINALRLENTSNVGVYAAFIRPDQRYTLALNVDNNGSRTFDLYDDTNGQLADQYLQGASGYRRFLTNGLERLRITSSGLVGVGTSTPSSIIEAATTTDAVATVSAGSSGAFSASLFLNPQNAGGFANLAWKTGTPLRFATQGNAAGASFSERMRLDSSGRLGIGTSSPAALVNTSVASGANTTHLLLSETGTTGSSEILIRANNSTQNWNMGAIGFLREGAGDNFALRFFTAPGATNTERMRLNSSGRLGIGTTNPGALLHIASSSFPSIRLDNTSTNYWEISNDSNLIFDRGGTERMRLDASGRLLVGTSSARSNFFNSNFSAALQVEGADTSSSNLSVVANRGGSPALLTLAASKGTTIGSNTLLSNNDGLGSIQFLGSDGTEFVQGAEIKAEVDGTSGANDLPSRLVFSVTQDGQASPTERLRITQTGLSRFYGNADTAYFATAQTSAGSTAVIVVRHSATSTTNGTDCLYILPNGNVQNTNNSYGAISDIKLKENIVDANSQWGDIKALQVRNYNLKEGQTHTQIGLVAQEVELVSPGLVTETPDRDEDGNDLGTVTKSVNYSVLYMKAVKALQEAMERIETLESKVAALEST